MEATFNTFTPELHLIVRDRVPSLHSTRNFFGIFLGLRAFQIHGVLSNLNDLELKKLNLKRSELAATAFELARAKA